VATTAKRGSRYFFELAANFPRTNIMIRIASHRRAPQRTSLSTLLASVIFLAVLTRTLSAQTFEVASIKPNTSDSGRSSSKLTPGELFIENVSLQKCIALAYGISEDRGGAIVAPDWVGETRYDIVAKIPPDIHPEQARIMFQNLLAERFKLKVHWEDRETQIYALLPAKNGPKLQVPGSNEQRGVRESPGRLLGMGVPVSALADHLSGPKYQLGRQVVDRTGLQGNYDFTLDWSADPDGVSLFTAVQEQLGLKLEAQKGSMKVLVVNSMEKTPTEN
jgi:uncharacterized protein (TIGR03435 family)